MSVVEGERLLLESMSGETDILQSGTGQRKRHVALLRCLRKLQAVTGSVRSRLGDNKRTKFDKWSG